MATTTKAPDAHAANGKGAREAALDRLNESLDAAQKAIKAVRRDVTTGGRDLVKDVEGMIAQARKDTSKLERAVRSDLADLQRAVTRQRASSSKHGKRPGTKPRAKARA